MKMSRAISGILLAVPIVLAASVAAFADQGNAATDVRL